MKLVASLFVLWSLLALPAELCGQTVRPSAGASPSVQDAQRFQQGTEALRAHQPAVAVKAFLEVTQHAPRFAEAYLNLGLALEQLGRNEEAVAALEQAVRLKAAMRGAHLFLAIADYKLGRFSAADLAVRKETALNAGDAQAWMWQGLTDLALGRLTFAVEDLDHAAAIDPKNVDILYHRGRAALALSRASYEEMFRIDPQSWHVHQVLAEADVETGNDLDAIEQFKQAIAAGPKQGGLYEALGSSLWRAGKYDEAQRAYETALQLDPNDTVTLYKLGCLRVDRADASGGKALLERVLVADPSLPMTTYYLGRAEAQLGHDEAAIADFNKTIALHPDEETTKQAYFQLSRVYRRVHNVNSSDEAQRQFRILDQKGKSQLEERMSQRRLRADRDTSIPSSSQDLTPAQPQ